MDKVKLYENVSIGDETWLIPILIQLPTKQLVISPHTLTHIHAHPCTHWLTFTYTHIHTNTNMHTHMHTHMHILYIHIYAHTGDSPQEFKDSQTLCTLGFHIPHVTNHWSSPTRMRQSSTTTGTLAAGDGHSHSINEQTLHTTNKTVYSTTNGNVKRLVRMHKNEERRQISKAQPKGYEDGLTYDSINQQNQRLS